MIINRGKKVWIIHTKARTEEVEVVGVAALHKGAKFCVVNDQGVVSKYREEDLYRDELEALWVIQSDAQDTYDSYKSNAEGAKIRLDNVEKKIIELVEEKKKHD